MHSLQTIQCMWVDLFWMVYLEVKSMFIYVYNSIYLYIRIGFSVCHFIPVSLTRLIQYVGCSLLMIQSLCHIQRLKPLLANEPMSLVYLRSTESPVILLLRWLIARFFRWMTAFSKIASDHFHFSIQWLINSTNRPFVTISFPFVYNNSLLILIGF